MTEDRFDAVRMSFRACPRCGGAHQDLLMRRFLRPSRPYVLWAMCPQTAEPVMVAELSEPDLAFYHITGLMAVDACSV